MTSIVIRFVLACIGGFSISLSQESTGGSSFDVLKTMSEGRAMQKSGRYLIAAEENANGFPDSACCGF